MSNRNQIFGKHTKPETKRHMLKTYVGKSQVHSNENLPKDIPGGLSGIDSSPSAHTDVGKEGDL